MMSNNHLKLCTKCNTHKETCEFYKKNHIENKLEKWCKACSKKYANAWAKNNSEKRKESHNKWRQKNPEKVKTYNKNFRERNKERLKKLAKTDKIRYSSLKSAAKRRSLEFNLSFEEYQKLLKQKCFYDGAELNKLGYALDRVDNSKGYVLENVVPCCTKCNVAKNNMSQQSFLEMCLNIVKNQSTKTLTQEKST